MINNIWIRARNVDLSRFVSLTFFSPHFVHSKLSVSLVWDGCTERHFLHLAKSDGIKYARKLMLLFIYLSAHGLLNSFDKLLNDLATSLKAIASFKF